MPADDTEQLFFGLVLQRGLATREQVQACIDGAVRSGNRGAAMQVLVERARIAPDVARSLLGEATAMARSRAGPGSTWTGLPAPAGLAVAGAPVGPGHTWSGSTSGAALGSWAGAAAPSGGGFGASPAPSQPWSQADANTPPSSQLRPTAAGSLEPGGGPAGARTASSFAPGMTFGRYQLERELGRGGMGVVWRARQLDLDRAVALKMLLAGALGDERRRTRFLAEARAVARLSHPNVVHIHDVGEHEGVLFFTMELVEGPSLSEQLKAGKLDRRRAVELAIGMADGLAAAHAQQLVHRDLKPANVLVDARGTAKITDFGIAKDLSSEAGQTAEGEVLGTPAYMPPEQASGRKDVDARADLYSLGAILYRMLVGAPPFDGATPYDVISKVLSQPAPSPRKVDPTVPKALEAIVARCLAKPREQRYASADELAAALRAALRELDGAPAATAPAAAGAGGGAPLVAIAAAVLLLVAGGAGVVAVRMRAQALAAEQALAEEKAREEAARLAALEAEKRRLAAERRGKAERLLAEAREREPRAPAEALKLARDAAEAAPDWVLAQTALGRLLRTVGRDPAGAVLAYERALALEPGSADARAGRARCLLDLGKPATDVEKEADGLETMGGEGRALAAELRADVALSRDELSVAVVLMDEAVRAAEKDARLRLRLAQLLLKARRYASAEEEAKATLLLDARSATALGVLAAAEKELGRAQDALKHAEEALKVDDAEPLARAVHQELRRLQQGGGQQGGGQQGGQPGQPHGDHDHIHAALRAGAQARLRGDGQGAARAYQAALELPELTCPGALLERARLGLALRQHQTVARDVERLSKVVGEKAEVLELAADLFVDLQRWDEALRYAEKAIGLDPNRWEGYYNRSHIHEKKGDQTAARADLDRMIEVAGGDGWVVHERAHYLARTGDLPGALKDMDEALTKVARSLPAGQLAHLHLTRGDIHYDLRAKDPANAPKHATSAADDYAKVLEAGVPPQLEEKLRKRLQELRP